MELTKQILEEMYVTKNMTYQEIAGLIGRSVQYVQNRIKEHSIKPRPAGGRKGKALNPEVIEKIRAKATGRKFSEEWRNNISKSKIGANHPNFGKKCPVHGKRIWYQCLDDTWVSMRSSWEVCYAEYLTKNQIAWKYEPETFLLESGAAYTPDFYLMETNEYVEVKGWLTEQHKARIEAFRTQYPDKKLILADRKYLTNLGINLKQVWVTSKPQFPCELCGKLYYKKDRSQRFCGKKCANKYIATTDKLSCRSQQPKRHYDGSQRGTHNSATKLTEAQVLLAVEMRKNGAKLISIKQATGISVGNLGNILKGRSWTHVTEIKQ